MVPAAAGHLDRAIEMIVDNAIRFSPADGTIHLRISVLPPVARLEIADEGPGVPPGLRTQLLQPFAVADLAHHQSGLGLGLATARTIVERLGGRLILLDHDGPGAVFAIELPLAAAPAENRQA